MEMYAKARGVEREIGEDPGCVQEEFECDLDKEGFGD